MKEVLVVLAEGFEEIEALAPVDLLRRAGCLVTVASLNKDCTALSSRKVRITADTVIDRVKDKDFDAIVLPGGMPGATNLASSACVKSLATAINEKKGLVSAICASPAVVLASFGLLKNKKAVCYPGMETADEDITWKKDRVLRDDNVITARGAGCAVDFALALVSALTDEKTASKLKEQIVC